MYYKNPVIISDIHLGSENSRTDELYDFLDNLKEIDLLVINGDLFDSLDSRLNKKHWKILSKLRKMSDDLKLVWCVGNHDYPHPEIIGHLIGAEICDEFKFETGENNIVSVICIHGHIWDDFITKHPVITYIADFIYNIAQRFDKNHNIAKWLKSSSKSFLRCKDKIKEEALQYLLNCDANIIVCGHTHFPENHGKYFNSGCWTEIPPSYLIFQDGNCIIQKYQNSRVV